MFNLKFRSFLGIYAQSGTLSCTVKRPDEVCASHTKSVGDNKTILQLKTFAEVLLTGLSFKNILYNHLTGNVGKQHIGKGWNKAEISELVQGKTFLLPKDPFENIKAILI